MSIIKDMYTLNIQVANLIYEIFGLPGFNNQNGEYKLNDVVFSRAILLLSNESVQDTLIENIPRAALPDKWRRRTDDIDLCNFTSRSCITLLKYVLNKQKVRYDIYKVKENRKNIYILTITGNEL